LSLGGIGLPTVLLAVQLVVGLAAAADLTRSLVRRGIGISTIGQALLAVILLALGLDGLFLGQDVVGQVVYATDLDPTWARPLLIALLVAAAALWSLDR
jgi:hypothetical protein